MAANDWMAQDLADILALIVERPEFVESTALGAATAGSPAPFGRAGPTGAARFVVFRCYDVIERSLAGGILYYESIDMIDAHHPQTILAYGMNGADLPVANGAPLRLRVERQLGYKHAKYVMRIEAVADFAHLGGGKGGFWEDRGYEWYAGI